MLVRIVIYKYIINRLQLLNHLELPINLIFQ